jgi:hypothetical protein
MQQVIPVLHDQTGVDRHADMLLECRIGLRLLEGMQLPVLEVAQPGSKSPARQGKETKDMIARATCVREVLLDTEHGLMVEQAIQHVRSLAFGGADWQDAEVAVLVG